MKLRFRVTNTSPSHIYVSVSTVVDHNGKPLYAVHNGGIVFTHDEWSKHREQLKQCDHVEVIEE